MKEYREDSYCASFQLFIATKPHSKEIAKSRISLVSQYTHGSGWTEVLQQYTWILTGPWSLLVLGTSLMPHFHGNWSCWLSCVKLWYFMKGKLATTAVYMDIQLCSLAASQKFIYNQTRGPNNGALDSCLSVVINTQTPLMSNRINMYVYSLFLQPPGPPSQHREAKAHWSHGWSRSLPNHGASLALSLCIHHPFPLPQVLTANLPVSWQTCLTFSLSQLKKWQFTRWL